MCVQVRVLFADTGSPGFTHTVLLFVKITIPGFAPDGFFT
jgi:hypothetical protein